MPFFRCDWSAGTNAILFIEKYVYKNLAPKMFEIEQTKRNVVMGTILFRLPVQDIRSTVNVTGRKGMLHPPRRFIPLLVFLGVRGCPVLNLLATRGVNKQVAVR